MTRFGWRWFVLVLVLCGGLALVGCEGDQGPAGPTGPAGDQGPAGPPGGTLGDVTYLGNQGTDCVHCHGSTVTAVRTTLHNQALDALGDSQDDIYCLQCHTTGWDSPVNEGDTQITNHGPDQYGYDDYWNVDTVEASSRRVALSNVQCESCHGPMGPKFNEHTPRVVFSTKVDDEVTTPCMPCHEVQFTEWETSQHANIYGMTHEEFVAEWGRGSCAPCHTSEGFIQANDPHYANYDFGGDYNTIGCVTCHDPHLGEDGGGNPAQLRTTAAVEVQYLLDGVEPGDAPRMEGYGPGQTCVQCHHARRDNANVAGQIANGSSHFGPHLSPQMDMYIGYGCYEIPGMTYDRSNSAHLSAENGCATCHMVDETNIYDDTAVVATHSFYPSVEACKQCHGQDVTDFNIDDMQTTVMGKLDQLAVLLGYADWTTLSATWDDDNASKEVWQREAGYAGVFVWDDGSLGVHNHVYANSLLDNAIAYCQEQLAP